MEGIEDIEFRDTVEIWDLVVNIHSNLKHE
jgi:hypothetical protein